MLYLWLVRTVTVVSQHIDSGLIRYELELAGSSPLLAPCLCTNWNSYLQARSKNDSGNTQEARNYGLLALCWNIGVIVYHIILWMGIIIAIIVVFARGGASTSASTGGNSGSESTCTYVLTQVCYTYLCGYKYVYKCS